MRGVGEAEQKLVCVKLRKVMRNLESLHLQTVDYALYCCLMGMIHVFMGTDLPHVIMMAKRPQVEYYWRLISREGIYLHWGETTDLVGGRILIKVHPYM